MNLPSDLRIRLTCHSVSQFLDRHAADVSRGGIFVRNAQVLPVGRTVRLNLQLANGSTLLAGEGTVFWTREADPTRAESEPGMGIRFTRLTAESQQMLTHLLSEKTERERHEEVSDFDEDERTVVATEEEMRAAAESHDEPTATLDALALSNVVSLLPPVQQLPKLSPPLSSVPHRALAALEATALPAPLPAAPVHAVPAYVPPAPAYVAPAPAYVAPAPAYVAPAYAATAPALLPVPEEAASAAWETDDDDSLDLVGQPSPPDADELTDHLPRGRQRIGIAVAIGAIAALAACLLLLNRPAATVPQTTAAPTTAMITAPVSAPLPTPAATTETAPPASNPIAPIAPLAPAP